jgi:HD-GYP domain-containing protein (c-di-GMP phosphodiesterase class II)
MFLNLVDLLSGISIALDFSEIDIFGVPTNHSRRVAYISNKIGEKLNMSHEFIFDLLALSMLHDNGISLTILNDTIRKHSSIERDQFELIQEHCIIGETNLQHFPFLTNAKNVIKYHHENDNGTGFFGIKGDQVPLMSQIIHLADFIDLNFKINTDLTNRSLIKSVKDYVRNNEAILFSKKVCDVFFEVAKDSSFWRGLHDSLIAIQIKETVNKYVFEYDYQDIRKITKTFSSIIDAKSEYTQVHSASVSKDAETMAKYYNMGIEETNELLMAADLHDLGKLGISSEILLKPSSLTEEEFSKIKEHPTIAYECLKHIAGFENIAKWIYNHHEKLDGSGYPRGISQEELDFNSRLLTCLDIFVALQENRPYRIGMTLTQTFFTMQEMVDTHKIDGNIYYDIKKVFSNQA